MISHDDAYRDKHLFRSEDEENSLKRPSHRIVPVSLLALLVFHERFTTLTSRDRARESSENCSFSKHDDRELRRMCSRQTRANKDTLSKLEDSTLLYKALHIAPQFRHPCAGRGSFALHLATPGNEQTCCVQATDNSRYYVVA